ncbi:hypothetical protein QTP86_007562 [Hemibagrus guttatus]|nr:hypothetical protein QTP86_007562 [Hemibagrus guttatus]
MVVHQGMRSYLLSADTQEDMLGWVRALRQSACMENDDLINRRCSSYHDFSQLGGSTESVNPLHMYKTQNKPCHTAGGVDMGEPRGRHWPSHRLKTVLIGVTLYGVSEEHEVTHTLQAVNPRKAAGPDGIPGRVLKDCVNQLAGVFTRIFNQSQSQSTVPPCLKSFTIISLPKKPHISNLNCHDSH